MIFRCFMLIITVVFLSSCQDSYEKNKEQNKEKYDSAVNQVIEIENERLQEENKPKIKRNKTGIIVYENGKLIQLLYRFKSKEVNSIYQKEKNSYKVLPENDNTFELVDDAEEEYIENLGIK